ncbi:recombinase zinc beta ribbon domain-containing protein [Clostridium sp. Cult2]|uniref:recombinase zinc beta ribbon domain-containing protein n=1 Tax=Clostridium sp. Cult2 TaxID=2079003 RepID=UPI001F2B917C
MLQNEKYKGDALLQKSYTVDFLTKKKKINEGEVPQYYVENSHPAIIEPETFDLVQLEMKKRKEAKGYKTGGNCFSGKIVFGECGSFYVSKVWHSNSKYRRTIWQCNHKFKNEKKCKTPHIYEDQIKEAFIKAFNSLIENKEEIIMGYEVILKELLDTTKLEKKVANIQNEMEVVEELFRKIVDENSRKAMDQKEYSKKYNDLVERYKKAQDELNEIEEKQQENKVRKDSIDTFIDRLKSQDSILTDFDETLWTSTIDKVVIEDDITFYFRDGTKIKQELS